MAPEDEDAPPKLNPALNAWLTPLTPMAPEDEDAPPKLSPALNAWLTPLTPMAPEDEDAPPKLNPALNAWLTPLTPKAPEDEDAPPKWSTMFDGFSSFDFNNNSSDLNSIRASATRLRSLPQLRKQAISFKKSLISHALQVDRTNPSISDCDRACTYLCKAPRATLAATCEADRHSRECALKAI
jgi:hypothetical protein